MVIKVNNFCIVLSSPSGAGKTSISKKILNFDKMVRLSTSCTTRPKRKGEVDLKDYIFLSDNNFERLRSKNKFLETANVFGYKYGTLKKTILDYFKKNKDVLFDIDWQGYQQLKQSNLDVIGIFILPPSKTELVKRLKNRDRDSKEEMAKRMSLVKSEISHFLEYDYVIINDDLLECTKKIINIINSERLKRNRQINLTSFIDKFRN